MKNLSKVSSIALLAASISFAPAARANNSHVEAAIQSFGDLSMFYQALLNTGVINELREDQHYTVFAPTNNAFSAIHPQTYPCFYAVECRSADCRDHA